jgi:hypothetical protein
MPLGTLTKSNYEPFEKKPKLEHKHQDEIMMRIKVNELISCGAREEVVYGTICIDNSSCPKPNKDESLIIKLSNFDSLSLVLPSQSIINGVNIETKLCESQPSIIHYKCNTESKSTSIQYEYHITREIDKNYYKIQLLLKLKNLSQFKFSYFNIHFKHHESQSITPTNSILTWGQLRSEKNIGLFWIIGNKLPKNGLIKLNFDITGHPTKVIDFETLCNFKIDNFQPNLLEKPTNHIRIEEAHIVPRSKLPISVETSLTSFDYKLVPIYTN